MTSVQLKLRLRFLTVASLLAFAEPVWTADSTIAGSLPDEMMAARLEAALQKLTQLQETLHQEMELIRKDLQALQGNRAEDLVKKEAPPASSKESSPLLETEVRNESTAEFQDRVINVDLGLGEREEQLFNRPTVFLQTRYSAGKLKNVRLNEGYEANFDLNRLELTMQGRVTDRFGMGFEIQYHPGTDGASEELVNLAYLDVYLNPHTTLRAGQFVRPFGFDIQQSSFDRENPERMNAVGYFFPGQRDRGVFLQGNLNFLDAKPLQDVAYWIGVSNGNNFFDDNNANVNLNFRVRKYYLNRTLATGVSAIVGNQHLPSGFAGNRKGNVFGVDAQWQSGRFGLRGEYVAGNMPSTLLSLPGPEDIEFAPAFRPGRSMTGGHVTALFQMTARDGTYLRYDQMNSDLVTGLAIKAFNFGYFHRFSSNVRLAFDYQSKNRPSFNDDAQNQRFAITLNSEF